MVFMEPSPADQLAGPLENFGKSLEKYLKPNREFQIAMQKAVALNPNLAQQLSNLEKNAPGSLQNLGFGDLGKVIASMPETPENQVSREQRGQIVSTDKAKLNLDQAQTGLSLDNINETVKFLNENKGTQIGADVIRKKLGLPTDLEQQLQTSELGIRKAETRHVTAEAAKEEAELPGVLAKADLANKALSDTVANYPQLSQYDPVRMMRTMMAGDSVPGLQQYLTLPGAEQALTQARIVAELQAQRDQTAYLRSLSNKQSNDEEKAKIRTAAQALTQTKAGTLSAWRTVLEDPAKVIDIRSKVKGNDLSGLDQSEKDVLHAADAQQQAQDNIISKQNRAENLALVAADRNARSQIIKDKTQANVDLSLAPVNSLLADQAKRSNSPLYQAVYGAIPPVGKVIGEDERRLGGLVSSAHGLYYVDEQGRRVEDNVALNIRPTGLSSDGLQALTVLNGLSKQERDKQLAVMKAKRPDIYKEIIGRIK